MIVIFTMHTPITDTVICSTVETQVEELRRTFKQNPLYLVAEADEMAAV